MITQTQRNSGFALSGLLIGAGFFAEHHAEAWKRIDGVGILAVADPTPGKAAAFAARHGIPRSYECTEDMLQREPAAFVDITTRPDTHLPLTRLAAAMGLNVICQKPMAPTLHECITMCEVCEAADVRLLIHENWRWQPWYREAKRLIEDGTIGAIHHLSFDWRTGDGNGPEPYAEQPYFRDMPRFIIFESLVHILDTLRFLAGELEITGCMTRRVNPLIAGEDWAEIKVRFASGSTGFIHGDRQTGPVPSPVAMGSMEIEGEQGTLRITPDGSVSINGRHLDFTPSTTGYKGDSVFATQKHLIDCLRNRQEAESEGRAYLRTVRLVENAYSFTQPALSSA
ncbi:MAG: Gfo/Idh/MocA family protein [Prosthecobacter sp.]|uniref:Gfo/Idh/MocA family protein n=1 Tax=Prosthecobacter sp. TaxID=1965333 RepID=UPI003900923B